jgi:hypothetical protein
MTRKEKLYRLRKVRRPTAKRWLPLRNRLRRRLIDRLPAFEVLATRWRHKRTLNRWDVPGILVVDGKVLWDGEAQYYGLPPLKRITVPVSSAEL